MSTLEERVDSLESTIREHSQEYRSDKKSIKFGAAVAVAFTAAFFGFTYWEMGTLVDKEVERQVTESISSKLDEVLDPTIRKIVEESLHEAQVTKIFEEATQQLTEISTTHANARQTNAMLQSLSESYTAKKPTVLVDVLVDQLATQHTPRQCENPKKWLSPGCFSAASRWCRSEHGAMAGLFQEFDYNNRRFLVACIY